MTWYSFVERPEVARHVRFGYDGRSMLRIWGNTDSVNVQKVLWCCEEIGLDYDRIDAGRHFGVVDTPQFRALNPNRLVPTIDDDGFVVWESNTIVRYLAARYSPGKLWPTAPVARADADRWLDWTSSTLWPALVPLFRAFYRTAEADRDPAAIELDRLQACESMELLDRHLASNAFVGGPTFTMGDLAAGSAAWRWFAMPIERPALRSLTRWFDELGRRPAFRKIVMQPLSP